MVWGTKGAEGVGNQGCRVPQIFDKTKSSSCKKTQRQSKAEQGRARRSEPGLLAGLRALGKRSTTVRHAVSTARLVQKKERNASIAQATYGVPIKNQRVRVRTRGRGVNASLRDPARMCGAAAAQSIASIVAPKTHTEDTPRVAHIITSAKRDISHR